MSGLETFQRPTYDVLPVPKGSWQAEYDKKNAKANVILAVGLLAGTATLVHACMDPLKPVTKADLPIDPREPI
ncbi:tRNA uridine(34) hydroxylase [Frankliniella fusca]|uniref:tRNA uridine(34) hydroxylase n=1 Tax=Frankliniella fusca TaxID=407009 RepID=A0AAE1GU17_9NEOP|nr:tRNA uridine(34) hydroxylase [Frankliniella fusca]